MGLWKDLKGFIRQLLRGPRSKARAPDSLARTLKESTHVRGARGGLARAGTEAQHEIVAKGHEHYDESFRADDDRRQRRSKG